MSKGCEHKWATNSGKGGEAKFERYWKGDLYTDVRCKVCGHHTWVTKEQWRVMNHG